jgi:hypothetical protein
VVIPPDPNAKVIRLAGSFSESKLRSVLERAMEQKADVTAVAPEPNRKVASKEN